MNKAGRDLLGFGLTGGWRHYMACLVVVMTVGVALLPDLYAMYARVCIVGSGLFIMFGAMPKWFAGRGRSRGR